MFSTVSIVFYVVAWVTLIRSVRQRETNSNRFLLIFVALGAISHSIAVYLSIHSGNGYQFSFFKVPSLFMWVINCIVLLSGLKKPLHNLFLLLLPLSVLAISIDLGFDDPSTVAEHRTPGMVSHILLSILAYSLLTIASLQALLLYYQNKRLKQKHPSGVIGLLPPLQTMETLLFELLWVGEILLTFSILTGIIYIDDLFAQHLAHKTVFSILSWLIYAVLLWGRMTIGWRGTAAIRWALGGFVALMLAYFGSKLVLEVILKVS